LLALAEWGKISIRKTAKNIDEKPITLNEAKLPKPKT